MKRFKTSPATQSYPITFTHIEKDRHFWKSWLLMPFKKELTIVNTRSQIEDFIKKWEKL